MYVSTFVQEREINQRPELFSLCWHLSSPISPAAVTVSLSKMVRAFFSSFLLLLFNFLNEVIKCKIFPLKYFIYIFQNNFSNIFVWTLMAFILTQDVAIETLSE